jgi:hypothetical protein
MNKQESALGLVLKPMWEFRSLKEAHFVWKVHSIGRDPSPRQNVNYDESGTLDLPPKNSATLN